MKSNHHNPHDDQLQAQADATWRQMESDDCLGQAIRESMESELPDANPQLREMLSERLANESPVESRAVPVGKESKLSSSRGVGFLNHWAVAVCVLFLLCAVAWGILSPASGPLADQAESPALVGPDQVALAQQDNSDSRKQSMTRFSDDSQVGGIKVDRRQAGQASGQSGQQKPGGKDTLSFGVTNLPTGNAPARDAHAFYESTVLRPTPKSEDTRASGGEVEHRYYVPSEGDEFGYGVDHDGDGQARFDWYYRESSGETYNQIFENQFLRTQGDLAISTFSIDVDTASYANIRRFLNAGQRPPRNAVRIEEMINYFNYDYPQPEGDRPFSVNMEVATCPWNEQHQLLRVGLKGQEIHRDERPVSNLVFLLDVSGSMNNADKLPLLKRGLRMMIDQLTENDRISIVTYAGNAGVVLEPTSGDQKKVIHEAIERLSSGGSTHGSAGIEKAYDLAARHFLEDGVNRVIWATDGDLNVGITDDQTLINLVSERAREGVFLTTLGFGTGNLKDGKLEQIANNGNGIYAYIDGMREARKVLIEQMSGSLVTIAKDVKLQIEFNPAEVIAYRLIGYENRMLKTEDFDNDAKDAGEIGAGHTVTALYEIVPAGVETSNEPSSAKLKYQTPKDQLEEAAANEPAGAYEHSVAAKSGELLTLALRYKMPLADESTRIEYVLKDSKKAFDEASTDFRFAASVAGFGMLLRDSKFRGQVTKEMVEQIASGAMGEDKSGYRVEFLDLVRRNR